MASKGQMITGGIAAAGILADILMGPPDKQTLNKTTEYLWKFVEHESIYSNKNITEGAKNRGYGPAPDIVGISQTTQPGHNSGKLGASNNIEHVDVVKNFRWTQSPRTARDDVPVLMLREKRIQVNPQINQIANNLFVSAEKAARGAEQIKDKIPQEVVDMVNKNQVTAENEIGKALKRATGSVTGAMDSMTSGRGVMSPYEDLYYAKDTGFVYSLPYMEDIYKSVANRFGGGSGINSSAMRLGGMLAENIQRTATAFNIADPGTYVEQPELYDFGNRQKKSYTVNFPLINTNTFNDVIRNWQLIFLLVYQNTPNRLTRDLIDPPCIYEANLDGTWFSKYAYIEKLDVGFKGATRKMSISIPSEVTADGSGDQQKKPFEVETIIPDVYNISLTVTEIFPETQNAIYHSVNHQRRRVTTGHRLKIEDNTPEALKRKALP